jgi:Zn-dependent M28 family amino/carboxypeptidase
MLPGLLLSVLVISGCTHATQADKPASQVAKQEATATSTSATAPAASPSIEMRVTDLMLESLPSINAARAFQYTREVTAFGPRPIGSANHKKLEDYIHTHLKGDDVEDDNFIADTPEGKFPIHNIVAKYPGTRDGIIVIAGHYDTNYPLRNTRFVGANDGGSSTAILLELANHLRGAKREGYSVWLFWTDGEEAVKEWTDTDSVYGARHLAEKWEKDGTLKKIKAFILTDMIADADLNIEREQHSAPWLQDLVLQVAKRYGYQSHFYARSFPVEDDHGPFFQRGVPCIDLIDLNYGYESAYWHTPQDTMDKLSPKSMQIVGDVILATVQVLDKQ